MSGRLEEAVKKAVKGFRPTPATVDDNRATGGGKSRTQRLRDRHHTIARMVAAGLPDERICFIMGMTQSSFLLLKEQTPAFAELVWHYEQQPNRTVEVEEYLDQKARIAKLAQLEIHDRLIEEPEKLSLSELLRINADYDDRTGFSKQSVNVQVNLDLAARLEHNRRQRQRTLAGAGDGGGALSQPVPSSGSAPPLLELQANPASSSGEPTEPVETPHSPPAPTKPKLHDMLSARSHNGGYYKPPVKEKMRRI